MAIRTDIYSVDWSVSPRVIWIDIAYDTADVQDMYDTCKHLEYLPNGMDEKPLCDAGGKEALDDVVSVGITMSLYNAVYAFADRPGPDWVICNMAGGNVVAFTDETRTTSIYPRKPTAYVSADRSASSSATLVNGGASGGLTPEQDQLLTDIDANVTIVDGKIDIIGSDLTTIGLDVDAIQLEMTDVWQAHFHRRKWNKIANTLTLYQVDKLTVKAVFDTNADMSDISPQ